MNKLDELIELIKPPTPAGSDTKSGEYFTKLKTNQSLLESRPWRHNPKYFTKVYISSVAIYKMAKHAVNGGNIEIMGSLMGKISENSIIVTDVFGIPVEGTETRVNAQIEGYEYMVSYLQSTNQLQPYENIVGWYHSHPGYGCWLSGIDVSTQSLNQIQDPYLAIVIDPMKSLKSGKIDIGAFRTYPEDYKGPESSEATKAKYGNYSDRYYSLDIEIYKSEMDEQLIKYINQETWINELIENKEINISGENDKISMIKGVIKSLEKGHKMDEASRLDREMARTHFNHILLSNSMDKGNEQGGRKPKAGITSEGDVRVRGAIWNGKLCYDSMVRNVDRLSNIELHRVSKGDVMSRLFEG